MLNLVQVSIEFSYAMPESKKKIVLEDTKTVATYRSALLFLGQGFNAEYHYILIRIRDEQMETV